jgi:hypothetical protein
MIEICVHKIYSIIFAKVHYLVKKIDKKEVGVK